jgi:hypothetical protein
VLLLEEVNDVLESRIVLERKAGPQRPFSVTVLLLLGRKRLRKAEERKSEVDEAILVVLELVLTIDELQNIRCIN